MHSAFVRLAAAAVVVAAVMGIARPAHAQVEISSKAMEIKLTGRVQLQFNHTSDSAALIPSTFFVRRARLTAEIKVNDFISGKIQPVHGEAAVLRSRSGHPARRPARRQRAALLGVGDERARSEQRYRRERGEIIHRSPGV